MKEALERQRLLMVRQTATVGKIAALLGELAGVKEVRVVEVTTEARRAQRGEQAKVGATK